MIWLEFQWCYSGTALGFERDSKGRTCRMKKIGVGFVALFAFCLVSLAQVGKVVPKPDGVFSQKPGHITVFDTPMKQG